VERRRDTQRALTNVGRHADATKARVSIRAADGSVVLIIEDDGVGIDPSRSQQNGQHGRTSS
jgi:signal transduction histidine kinase